MVKKYRFLKASEELLSRELKISNYKKSKSVGQTSTYVTHML